MHAFIPTIGASPYLWPLVDTLAGDVESGAINGVWIGDNGTIGETKDRLAELADRPGVEVWDTRGLGIYEQWNHALDQGATRARYVALLNDDIEVAAGALAAVADLADTDHDVAVIGLDYNCTPIAKPRFRYCHGSWRLGGIGGFAFVVAATVAPRVDTQFEWWGGDDDLFWAVEEAGHKLAVAEGVCVLHHHSISANQTPWTGEAAARDHARLLAKWGKAW